MKTSALIVALLYVVAYVEVPKFSDAVELKVNNASIKIFAASPHVVDWNEDGKKDLIVGEFNLYYPDGGRIHYFENIGTDKLPVLKSPVYLKAGGIDIALSSS